MESVRTLCTVVFSNEARIEVRMRDWKMRSGKGCPRSNTWNTKPMKGSKYPVPVPTCKPDHRFAYYLSNSWAREAYLWIPCNLANWTNFANCELVGTHWYSTCEVVMRYFNQLTRLLRKFSPHNLIGEEAFGSSSRAGPFICIVFAQSMLEFFYSSTKAPSQPNEFPDTAWGC
jgi:hypothetical protein